jgi:hypothetical protein
MIVLFPGALLRILFFVWVSEELCKIQLPKHAPSALWLGIDDIAPAYSFLLLIPSHSQFELHLLQEFSPNP